MKLPPSQHSHDIDAPKIILPTTSMFSFLVQSLILASILYVATTLTSVQVQIASIATEIKGLSMRVAQTEQRLNFVEKSLYGPHK